MRYNASWTINHANGEDELTGGTTKEQLPTRQDLLHILRRVLKDNKQASSFVIVITVHQEI